MNRALAALLLLPALMVLPWVPRARGQAPGPEAACLAAPTAACLVDLAATASLAARDEDRLLPSLAGALARAGRLDAAEAIRQRLQRDEARREDAADRILVAELLWAARHDPARPADLGQLELLAERARAGVDGAARRIAATAELARMLCRDHAARRGGAPRNATFAALLDAWPGVIAARPPRRQPPDWEALAEALACAGESEAATAALRRAASVAPGTAHPGRMRALVALEQVPEAEATALDLRPEQRGAGLLEVASLALREGRQARALALAGFAAEAAAYPRLAVAERQRVLRGVARLRHAAGDAPGAREAAEAVRALAEPPEVPGPAALLLEAAGALNDIGQQATACALVGAAQAAAQAGATPARRPAASGETAPQAAAEASPVGRRLGELLVPGAAQRGGPVRLPGIGDELRARAAVELHRCGQAEAGLRLLRETVAAPRATGWIELRKSALVAGVEAEPPGRFADLIAPDQRGRVALALAEFHAAREEVEPAAAWVIAALENGAGGVALAEAATAIGRRDLAARALRRIGPAQLRAGPAERATDLLALAAQFESMLGEPPANARR